MTSAPDRRPWTGALLLAALLALAGCGAKEVVVQGQFPQPLMSKLPLTLGVWYEPAFREHEFFDEAKGRAESDWLVRTGEAQVELWDTLLNGMFEAAVPVAGPEAAGADVDGVLVPNIEEVQFSTPEQTRSDYFEVWVRYRMRLHGRDGALVGEWPLTAYGKANARNYGMNSREPALQAAALAAMRDAMAFFTVQFRTVPPVQTWLQAELAAPAAAPTGGASP